jgi:hypothetical protein
VDPNGGPDRRLHRKSNPDSSVINPTPKLLMVPLFYMSSASAQFFNFTPSLTLKSLYVLTHILILLLIGELFFY